MRNERDKSLYCVCSWLGGIRVDQRGSRRGGEVKQDYMGKRTYGNYRSAGMHTWYNCAFLRPGKNVAQEEYPADTGINGAINESNIRPMI